MKDTLYFANDLLQTEPFPISKHVFLIAEIGINHNGSIDIAKKLIELSKGCGFDAVKFQKRTIDIVYTKDVLDTPRESPWGTTTRQQKEGLEFGEKEFDQIDAFCKEIGIEWFASAWDVPSQKFFQKYKLNYNKIASAMLTHTDLLQEVANERRVTFISTGMSTYEQIDEAVKIFKKADCPIVLMHTISEYPADESTLNLNCIHELRKRYHCPVGYSGHEVTVAPSVIAASMGAVAIERHVTLDRSMYGSDQSASLEKRGMEMLSGYIRTIPVVMGDGVKKITAGEAKVAQKLRYQIGPKNSTLK